MIPYHVAVTSTNSDFTETGKHRTFNFEDTSGFYFGSDIEKPN
jgi:hypothetical protein